MYNAIYTYLTEMEQDIRSHMLIDGLFCRLNTGGCGSTRNK